MTTSTDRALAMIAADRRFRAGDESAAEDLYELLVELIDSPGSRDEVHDTMCALIDLVASPPGANDARVRAVRDRGLECAH